MLINTVVVYSSLFSSVFGWWCVCVCGKDCRDSGSNQGPSDLQSDALPTELSWHGAPHALLPHQLYTKLQKLHKFIFTHNTRTRKKTTKTTHTNIHKQHQPHSYPSTPPRVIVLTPLLTHSRKTNQAINDDFFHDLLTTWHWPRPPTYLHHHSTPSIPPWSCAWHLSLRTVNVTDYLSCTALIEAVPVHLWSTDGLLIHLTLWSCYTSDKKERWQVLWSLISAGARRIR